MLNSNEIEQFGIRLRELREASGLTQEALAFEANVHALTIRRAEKGKHPISLDLLFSLSKALKVYPADLFEGVDVAFEE